MSDWPEVLIERAGSTAEVAERVCGLDRGRGLGAVVADLRAIERAEDGYTTRGRRGRARLRRRPDGVACFNYLYLSVTEGVLTALPQFEHAASVERLAVVFAEYYLSAYRAAKVEAEVSKAWAPLFESRAKRGVAPIQFALAGMNAHINNDLPWALLQAWEEFGVEPEHGTAEHRDFELVNGILSRVQGEVRATLESGLLRWLDRVLGRLDDLVASISVARARDEAWERATRWSVSFDPAAAAAHERQVGYQSHLILAA
jgi:hypothetical protein